MSIFAFFGKLLFFSFKKEIDDLNSKLTLRIIWNQEKILVNIFFHCTLLSNHLYIFVGLYNLNVLKAFRISKKPLLWWALSQHFKAVSIELKLCMVPCVSSIYLTYCMEYVWKSSLWIGIFQRATQPARILFSIDRQYTERGQL